MTRLVLTKTSFTAGELDPRLLGRLDLRAQDNGASLLRNVVVQPTGGVTRRPGLAHVAGLQGGTRLVGFDAPDGGALVVFGGFRVEIVHANGTQVSLTAPWSDQQARELCAIRRGNALLICHPEVEPRRLVRQDTTSWTLSTWDWADEASGFATPYLRQPYARYAGGDVAIQPKATGIAATDPIPAGTTVTLQASADLFNAYHNGVIVRIKRREVMITNVVSPAEAVGLVRQTLLDGQTTRDWDEAAFSQARGWPATAALFQSRLVLGGVRDMPDGLWFSKSGRIMNFDTGTGLDDEAVLFRLGGDRMHAIRSLLVGRHLQVFTTAGEWIVGDEVLTPATVRVRQQTAIGSDPVRRVEPIVVDGATLFVPRGGEGLREFLYTDSEQAYQANDIALLARHLVVDPVATAFDPARRLMLMVLADGTAAVATIDRNTSVVAWGRLDTAGLVRSAALHQGALHLLVERAGAVTLERLDEAVPVDAARRLVAGSPQTAWTGLAALDGREVQLIGDGVPLGRTIVTGGAVVTPEPVGTLVVGLPFTSEIAPSRITTGLERGGAIDPLYRPVRVALRLLDSRALRLDTGEGPVALELPETPFTGDVSVRLAGWRRGLTAPLWRIVQDDPLPLTVLSATHELKVMS